METVEIIVYMVVAIAIGMLLIAFIGGWDAKGTFGRFKELFTGKDATSYETITSSDLSRTVLATWESCGLGTTDLNKTVYVKDSVPLNKTMVFASIKEANLCRTIQWNESGCGVRDDMVFADTMGPVVLQLRCDATARKLIITS